MTNDERAISDLVQTWQEATRAGDSARVLSLMSDDVVFMVAGKPPFGKAEFAANSQQLSNARIDSKSEIVELEVSGNFAWARTRLDVTITPAQGSPSHRSGYTLTIFRKQANGSWLLARDANLLGPA
jgi:uncharacterized protein (TIGR02246 family)